MSTFFSPALITALFLFVASTSIAADPTPVAAAPILTIDEAIVIAKTFVAQNHIDVRGSYIDSARLDPNPRGGKFWLVTWLRNEYASGVAIKGGQTYLKIHMDKSAEIFHGE